MKKSMDREAVKPSLLYIFLGSIFVFAIVMFLASCTSAKEDLQPGLSVTNFSPSSAAVGSSVTITGNNFDEDTTDNTVIFNDTPALVTAASKTTLTVVVPQAATSGKISVTVNSKTVVSPSDFTVIQ